MTLVRLGLVTWVLLLGVSGQSAVWATDFIDPKPASPFCGIYSLYTALRTEGIELEFSSLVQPQYVGSSSGSSIAEIVQAAHDHHAKVEVLTNLSVADLHHLDRPAILHVKNGYDAAELNHFILCVPVQGQLTFYDPPDEAMQASGHELAALWGGTAIIVSAEPISLASMRIWAVMRITILVGVIFAGIGISILFCRTFNRRYGSPKLKTQSLFQSSLVLMTAMVLATAFQLASPEGFVAQRNALVALNQAHFAEAPNGIDLAAAQRLLSEGALFIDARHADDYDSDHIQGAINIPPDSTRGDIEQWLQPRTKDRKIVVYCESPSCPFAAQLAKRLNHFGLNHIDVMIGGWTQWKATAQKTLIQSHMDDSLTRAGS
jgi:rhodanese-related sulfurtransferase